MDVSIEMNNEVSKYGSGGRVGYCDAPSLLIVTAHPPGLDACGHRAPLAILFPLVAFRFAFSEFFFEGSLVLVYLRISHARVMILRQFETLGLSCLSN